jgi:hypothetical protein
MCGSLRPACPFHTIPVLHFPVPEPITIAAPARHLDNVNPEIELTRMNLVGMRKEGECDRHRDREGFGDVLASIDARAAQAT